MLFEFFGGVEGSRTASRNARTRFDKASKEGKAKGPYSTIKHALEVPCSNLFELLNALDEFAKRIYK